MPLMRRASLLLIALLTTLSLTACQSDEQRTAALMENGREATEQGQHAEATIEFRKALQIDPNLAEAHYALADSYAALSKGPEAYWEYSETVRLEPSDTDARLKLGALALLMRDFDEALTQAEATIALRPDSAAANLLLGQSLQALGRGNEAEAPLLRTIELAPEEPSYLLVLASHYTLLGRRDDAEALLVKIIEMDPGFDYYLRYARFFAEDPSREADAIEGFKAAIAKADTAQKAEAYHQYATMLASRDRRDDALVAIEEGITAVGEDPAGAIRLMYMKAQIYERTGRREEADAVFEAATRVDPTSDVAQMRLSLVQSRNGDLAGALESAQRARELNPDDPRPRLRVAELLAEAGVRDEQPERLDEAGAIADEVLAQQPTNADALFVKARIALAQEDLEEAMRLLRETIDSRPNLAQAHYLLGSALAASGDTNAARGEVSRALELDENIFEARRLLAQLHASLGEYEFAVEEGRAYLNQRADPAIRLLVAKSLAHLGRHDEALLAGRRIPEETSNALAAADRVRLYLRLGETDKARSLLLRALEASARHPALLALLLRVEGETDKLEEAGQRILSAAEADPSNSELARLVGLYHVRKNDSAKAEVALKRAIELDSSNLAAHRQLASVYRQTGRTQQSIATYEKAIEERPASARLHYVLGSLYHAEGRTQDAIQRYEEAIRLQADLTEAKNNLAYLLAESGADLDRALYLAQEAKAAMPDSPSAADTLGWVLYRRGIPAAAVGYLREAVAGLTSGTPESDVTRYHLALAYQANSQEELAVEALEALLSEFDARQKRERTAGTAVPDPPWAGEARAMLTQLTNSG